MSTDYVRVRDERTGHAYTVPAHTRLQEGVRPMVGAPAVGRGGLPLPPAFGKPPKQSKTKAAEPAAKETTQTAPASRAEKKEN